MSAHPSPRKLGPVARSGNSRSSAKLHGNLMVNENFRNNAKILETRVAQQVYCLHRFYLESPSQIGRQKTVQNRRCARRALRGHHDGALRHHAAAAGQVRPYDEVRPLARLRCFAIQTFMECRPPRPPCHRRHGPGLFTGEPGSQEHVPVVVHARPETSRPGFRQLYLTAVPPGGSRPQ